MDGASLKQALHQRGINLRYLGHVIKAISQPEHVGSLRHIMVRSTRNIMSKSPRLDHSPDLDFFNYSLSVCPREWLLGRYLPAHLGVCSTAFSRLVKASNNGYSMPFMLSQVNAGKLSRKGCPNAHSRRVVLSPQGVEVSCLSAAISHFLCCLLVPHFTPTPGGEEAKKKSRRRGRAGATESSPWSTLTGAELWNLVCQDSVETYNISDCLG